MNFADAVDLIDNTDRETVTQQLITNSASQWTRADRTELTQLSKGELLREGVKADIELPTLGSATNTSESPGAPLIANASSDDETSVWENRARKRMQHNGDDDNE